MRAARIPGRLSSCPPSLPLSLSGYPSFSSKPFDAARANLRGKRVAHEHVYIYIYLYVCLLRACVYVRVRVYSKRDEAESGGTGGESCALN